MVKNHSQKKADISETLLLIAIILGGLIISIWYITYINTMTLQDQNVIFNNLNKYTKYYNILCESDEAKIEKIHFKNDKDNLILTFNNTKVCIEAQNFAKSCNEILCKQTYQKKFNLQEENFFDFIKENGIIQIQKY
jgi:hypothetical protein